ncbi:MAG: YihY/virulence factor BrkB family protein [Thermoanaerobaculia bacterium]
MQRRLRSAAALTRAIWREWQRDNGMMLAAAIAFYATFLIAPLLLLLLNAGALRFGEETARARLLALVADGAGARAAAAVDRIIIAPWIRENLPEVLGDAGGLWRAAELVVSYSLPAIVFAAVLKFVPDVELKWRHVAIGAGVGALVFVGGQQLISAYLARARVTAAYGAAGSVVLLLLYVYFTAAVILLSAELTERFARDDAEFRSERLQAQAEQGYSPHKEEGAG